MEILLGNKERLGIELTIDDSLQNNSKMGYCRLWFGGHAFGTIHDYIYLDSYLLGGLFEMVNVKEISDPSFPDEPDSQFQYFEHKAGKIDDEEIDFYRVSFGTLTDSFIKWTFRKGTYITILWKIRSDNKKHLPEDLRSYPKQILHYTMPHSEFKIFVERLQRIIDIW